MRAIVSFLAGIALVSVCVADSAPPHRMNLLSDKGNLDIKTDQWTLSGDVLAKNSATFHGDKLLVVKEDVVKVPVWYSLGCHLVNIRKQNDKYLEAGLLFGFVDEKNYWSLMMGQELSQPVLKLVQLKDGMTVTETSVPLNIKSDQNEMAISVEVHHDVFVKIYARKSLVLTHKVPAGIGTGRVGLSLQSGLCSFSKVSISGIAKR